MQPFDARELRKLAGQSVRAVADMTLVCEDTVKRYERGVQIQSDAIRERLDAHYAWLRLGALQRAQWLRQSRDAYDDPTDPPTMRPADSGVHLIETIPAPPGVPSEFRAA